MLRRATFRSKSAEQLAKNPLIRRVIPISLGDSFRGFRIVGTSPDYIDLYGGKFASGQMWHEKMQAVLGASVAAHARLTWAAVSWVRMVSSKAAPIHGDSIYTVVGVLQPTGTVLDRLVVVNTESVWFVHEGKLADPEEEKVVAAEREVTMLLVQYATPLAAVSLPRKINAETNMQSASPAYESARLFRMIGVGADVIRAFGGVVLATAALSLFIALYHALNERAYDIAVLRTLGARPPSIAVMLLLEALILALLGGILGLAARARPGRDPGLVDDTAGKPAYQWRVFRGRAVATVAGADCGGSRGAAAQLARGAGQHIGDARTPQLSALEETSMKQPCSCSF